jgi:hypothetical protein
LKSKNFLFTETSSGGTKTSVCNDRGNEACSAEYSFSNATMTDELLLTIEQLACVLKIPEQLMASCRQQGILPPSADDPEQPVRYRRSEVVRALRKHPEIMDEIRRAMRQGDDKHHSG